MSSLRKVISSKAFVYTMLAVVLGGFISGCCHRNHSVGIHFDQNSSMSF